MLKNLLAAALGLSALTAETPDAEVAQKITEAFNNLKAKLASAETKVQEAENKLKAQEESVIKDLLDNAEKDQRINAEQRTQFEALAKSGQLETVKNLVNSMAPRTKLSSVVNPTGANPTAAADRDAWDWDKWQKEDPKGIEAMEASNHEQFIKLYNAKFGTNLK